MRFLIRYTSDPRAFVEPKPLLFPVGTVDEVVHDDIDGEVTQHYIEFASLEELMAFQGIVKEPLILTMIPEDDAQYYGGYYGFSIEIYNDYRE